MVGSIQKMAAICALSVTMLAHGHVAYAQALPSLKIVTLVNPAEKPALFSLFEKINTEICRRMHYSCTLSYAPSARAAAMVETGEMDGENYRIFDFLKDGRNPHHVRVDAPLYVATFIAWGRPLAPKVSSWQDLIALDRDVIYLFGSKIVVNRIGEAMGKKLQITHSVESGLNMLMANRASYLIGTDGFSVEHKIKELQLQNAIVNLGVVEKADTYMYLNEKHVALVPKMKEAIEQMRKDGTLQNLLREMQN